MFLHPWTPQRPHSVPLAGTFVSLTVHAAFVAAVVATDGSGTATTGERTRAGGTGGGPEVERIHWVGLGANGTAPHGARPAGTRPPSAYVIPGRGGSRVVAAGALGDDDAGRVGEAGQAGRRAMERRAPALAAGAPGIAPPHAAVAPRAASHGIRLPLVPDVVLPELEATLLVAGVVSSTPDLTRRLSRPEDFAPPPDSSNGHVTSSALAMALQYADPHVSELPIPLVSNPPPTYPAALQRAQVGGQVVVEFVIDSVGVVDLHSLRVVASTNSLFTEAVQRVLPRLRFLPAQFGAHTVGMTVRQPFLFVIRPGS